MAITRRDIEFIKLFCHLQLIMKYAMHFLCNRACCFWTKHPSDKRAEVVVSTGLQIYSQSTCTRNDWTLAQVRGGRCPRCEVCGRAVRVRGVGRVGVWCSGCLGAALPFVGLGRTGSTPVFERRDLDPSWGSPSTMFSRQSLKSKNVEDMKLVRLYSPQHIYV